MDATHALGELRGYITIVTLATFLGIVWWAYRGRNRQRFDEAARIPFLEDEAAERAEVAEVKR